MSSGFLKLFVSEEGLVIATLKLHLKRMRNVQWHSQSGFETGTKEVTRTDILQCFMIFISQRYDFMSTSVSFDEDIQSKR